MTDADMLEMARKRWKRRFPKMVRVMERLLNGRRDGNPTPRAYRRYWCTDCDREHIVEDD